MNENYHEYEPVKKCSIWKHIMTGLLTFLAAFCAFYVVTDWHYKQMLSPAYQMRKMQHFMNKEERKIDKLLNSKQAIPFSIDKPMGFENPAYNYIKLEKEPNNYKITVDLKPFNNNEKNVEVKTEGNTLTISAASENQKLGKERLLKVSQNFMFDNDVKLSDMTKFKQGNELLIFVPLIKD